MNRQHCTKAKQIMYMYMCMFIHISQTLRLFCYHWNYCQTSNIRRTKSQNLNVSHLVLQLSLPNLLKPAHTHLNILYLKCVLHNDVMTCESFSHYWPFVMRPSVDSPHKWPVIWSFGVALILAWTSCRTKSWVADGLRYHDIHVTDISQASGYQCKLQ